MKCKIEVGATVIHSREGMRPTYEWTEKLKNVELFIRCSIKGKLTCMFPEKDLHLIGDCCDIFITVNEADVIMVEEN